MNLLQLLATGAPPPPTYIEDVFSAYLYTGTSATRSIVTGIDTATKGGMVWVKSRNTVSSSDHQVYDTERGAGYFLTTNSTAAQVNGGANRLSFNTDGWSTVGNEPVNYSTDNYASWTFRKATKFFDIVTYTGNGASSQTIAHSLGITPGMIIIKKTSGTSAWSVYHRSQTYGKVLYLNTTDAEAADGTFNPDATATQFTAWLGAADGHNANGATYVAYLFAHDDSATGLIQCGTFQTDGSSTATVDLAWEPQFVLVKTSSTANDWKVADIIRGWVNNGGTLTSESGNVLKPNSSAAEAGIGTGSGQLGRPLQTGFTWVGDPSVQHIYMAIRRGPMKAPTSGTQVYNAGTRNAALPGYTAGFPVDMAFRLYRPGAADHRLFTRLIGGNRLVQNTTAAEVSDVESKFDLMTGWGADVGATADVFSHMFRRYPGVFDMVCYTGTGAAHTEAHNLTVAPELMIVKCRNNASSWLVYNAINGNDSAMFVNSAVASSTGYGAYWNTTTPTASVFSLGNSSTNTNTYTFVAYLFATLAGISKVGTYTGNGTNQTINCGFTAGARFVLVKATSTTGNWLTGDSTRGIIAGNDPYLSLNSTAAEVTNEDWLDPDNSGFIVNETTAAANTNGVTYIYLAFS